MEFKDSSFILSAFYITKAAHFYVWDKPDLSPVYS
jgi:hypothetical protein